MALFSESLLPDFILRQYLAGRHSGVFEGPVLFADVSGSTALSEALARHGRAGTEELSHQLNALFGGMIDQVHAHGGFIGKFVGDAIACFFPDVPPAQALACAKKLLDLAEPFDGLETQFGRFAIGIRIGIACAETRWGILGSESTGYSYYFAGEAVQKAATIQGLADTGEAVFPDDLIVPEAESEQARAGLRKLIQCHFPIRYLSPARELVGAESAVFIQSTLADTPVSEHRRVVPVFVRIHGLNWERDDYHQRLEQAVGVIRDEVERYNGFLAELDFGDKGHVFPIFFGAPVAHEDDIARALSMSLRLRDRIKALPGLDLSIGISVGQAYSGLLGNPGRASYTCLGDIVNLAARLMESAPAGEIRCSEDVATVEHGPFDFRNLGNLTFKGKRGSQPVHLLQGIHAAQSRRFREAMVGRRPELRRLLDRFGDIFEGLFGGVVYIHGDAGMGKTRLVWALHEHLEWSHQAHGWHLLPCDSILKLGYSPFTTWMKTRLGYRETATPEENRRLLAAHLRRYLDHPNVDAELREQLSRTESVVAGYLGFPAEDALWNRLDPISRKDNWEAAIKAWVKAEACLVPSIFVLEDAQGLDEESAAFLTSLVTNVDTSPFALAILTRFHDDGSRVIYHHYPEVAIQHLDLGPLRIEDSRTLMSRTLGSGSLMDELVDYLQERSGGNPFLLEQFLLHAVESGALTQEEGHWKLQRGQAELPVDVETLLVARLDRLPGSLKRMLQAASVIGRGFTLRVLEDLLAAESEDEVTSPATLRELISEAEREDLLLADDSPDEPGYTFKHGILHEAIYNMQLLIVRKKRHGLISTIMERVYADKLLYHAADLARHASLAGEIEKARNYFVAAGDWAAASSRHSESLANYHEALARIDEPADRSRILEKIGTIREFTGPYSEALRVYQEALGIQRDIGPSNSVVNLYNSIGVIYDRLGDTARSLESLGRAQLLARELDDQQGEGSALVNLALAYLHRGEYTQAESHAKQALVLLQAEEVRDRAANALNVIGLVYERQGKYAESLECHQATLEIYRTIGDRRLETFSHHNTGAVYERLGRYSAAIAEYKEVLEICREIGGRLQEAHAYSGLGAVYRLTGLTQEAVASFEKALAIYTELGDQQAVGASLNNMGACHKQIGDIAKALDYYQRALGVAEDLGDLQGRGTALNNVGLIHYAGRDFTRAIECFETALRIWRDLGDRQGESVTLNNMALVHDKLGDYPRALATYEESLKTRRAIGDRQGEGLCLNNIGSIYISLGFAQKALTSFRESLQIRRALGDRRGEAITLRNIGGVFNDQENEEDALRHYEESLRIAEEIGNKVLVGINLLDIARVLLATEARDSLRHAKGREHLVRSLLLLRELGDKTRIKDAEVLAKEQGLVI